MIHSGTHTSKPRAPRRAAGSAARFEGSAQRRGPPSEALAGSCIVEEIVDGLQHNEFEPYFQPKVDGIEVLRQIKAEEATRSIPVVMLTSSAEERDVIETYRLGVNSYIVKPVDFSQFNETVAKAGLYWMLVNKTPG